MKPKNKITKNPKNVRIDRLNKDYVCGECGNFLMVYGMAKNKEWNCTECGTYYREEELVTKALTILLTDANGDFVSFKQIPTEAKNDRQA